MNNRSDFSANLAEVNHVWYQDIQYSPAIIFGNAITILSGKTLANNANGLSILSSFSSDIWLSFCLVIVVMTICNRILHMEYSKWTIYLLGVLGQFMKLWAVFINQSIQLANICCVKHLILNSVTIISIFLMTLFFTSEILSKLLLNPLVKIDTLDDLVRFVKQHDDVKIITDKSAWSILKEWQNEQARFITTKVTHETLYEFDYEQVYHGKLILISLDSAFERIFKFNRHLTFHMSADRLFGYQYGFLYSKYIDINTKIFIDSIMTSLFESGVYNFMVNRKWFKRLNIEEDDSPRAISITHFKKIVIIYSYMVILMVISLIFEIYHYYYN